MTNVELGRGLRFFLANGLLIIAGMGTTLGAEFGKVEFLKFSHIYEPSGVQQLADGRFLVVQDESAYPLDLFSLQTASSVVETPLHRRAIFSGPPTHRLLNNLEDLEGVASDDQGYIYAITSHSRKENGKRDRAREQLVRFRLDGMQIDNVQGVTDLRKQITDAYPALKQKVALGAMEDERDFNIEGLSFDAGKKQLLIGLRAPLSRADEAIIVVLDNPQAFVTGAEPARFSQHLFQLDLKGGGIRGLAYDSHLGGYLIISGRQGKPFKLWLWEGKAGIPARQVKIAGAKNLHQAEGITSVVINGRPAGILIVSDDGDGQKKKPGRYLFATYEQLEMQ